VRVFVRLEVLQVEQQILTKELVDMLLFPLAFGEIGRIMNFELRKWNHVFSFGPVVDVGIDHDWHAIKIDHVLLLLNQELVLNKKGCHVRTHQLRIDVNFVHFGIGQELHHPLVQVLAVHEIDAQTNVERLQLVGNLYA